MSCTARIIVYGVACVWIICVIFAVPVALDWARLEWCCPCMGPP